MGTLERLGAELFEYYSESPAEGRAFTGAMTVSISIVREPSWQEEGWTIPATIKELARLHSNTPEGELHLDPEMASLDAQACVAIEDAMVLGRAQSRALLEKHLGHIESTRKERANSIQLASRQQADELQGVTKRGPNPGANADDRGLYLYNPVTVPLAPAYQ